MHVVLLWGVMESIFGQFKTLIGGVGNVQNVSREAASRCIIRDNGAVPPLTIILVGSDMQAQVITSKPESM